MAARILDGTKIASEIRVEVTSQVKALSASGVRPGLAVVLVGHNPASEVYVRGKVKSSEEVSLYSEQHTLAESTTTEELLALIADLNRRNEIDGILVQLPLPAHVDAKMKTTRTPTGLKFTRWLKNSVPPPSYVRAAGFKGRVDRCQQFEFVAPSSVLQWTGATDAGTATSDPERDFPFQFGQREVNDVVMM